jgi:hypothetical protein
LNALIDALPSETATDIPARTIAADLVALLPRNEKLNDRSPDNVFATVDSRQTQILMALSAFMIMLLIRVPAISHCFAPETVRIRHRLAAMTPQRVCHADKDRLDQIRDRGHYAFLRA